MRVGWVVAAMDVTDEEPRWLYPMRSEIGVISNPNVMLSANCHGRVVLDSPNQDLMCAPDEDEPFVFGIATRTSTEDGWTSIHYEYVAEHARLLRNTLDPSLYLLDLH
jgi:hypothetical protein